MPSKHPKPRSPERRSWYHMKERCKNPNSKDYPQYGGRGISVCARWDESFANFIADMGQRPSDRHSLDRIDVNGNYEPSNCRWADALEQARNKRNNHRVGVAGNRLTLTEAQCVTGIQDSTIRQRINLLGWTEKEAVSRAVRQKHYVTLNGERMAAGKAAKILGIHPNTLRGRIRSGWPEELALSVDPKNGNPHYGKRARRASCAA